MNILIVDDNQDDRRILRYLVEKHGHRAIEAQNGLEALRKIKDDTPALIISDALMPIMDGFQFLRAVKQDAGLRSIPFVFYSSSYREDKDIHLAISLGADAFVVKPVEPAEFWEKIEAFLVTGRREKAAPLPLVQEDAEYLRCYSEVVATKLEEKVRELEQILAEQRRTEEELCRVNRALRILSDSNQAVIRSANEANLIEEICQIIVKVGGYCLAWVGFAEHDEAKTIRPVAHAGIDSGYIKMAQITWADSERGRGPGGVAIRTGQPCVARNIPTDPAFALWREEALQRGYQSVIALPLANEGQTFGALGIYAGEVNAFDTHEMEILKELAGDLAYGIASLRTRIARARAEAGLDLFRQLLNQSNDAIFVVDPATGVIQDANDTACRSLGYTREEVLGLAVTQFDHSMRDSIRWDEHVKVLKTKGSLTVESQHLRTDGTTFPVEVSVRYTVQNQKEYLIAVVRDITERKRAEEVLRFSEAKYRIVANNTYDWEFWIDPEGHFLYTSPSCERISGYKPADFQANPNLILHLVHPVDRPQFESHWQAALKGHREDEREFRIVRPDGIERWIGHVCGPVYDETGKFLGVRGSNRDITERKRVEEVLRQSETDLQLALEAGHLGDWKWNIITGELVWSARCKALYDLPPEANVSYERFLSIVHPEDREHVRTALTQAVETRTDYEVEKRVIWSDGSVHWQATRGKVFCDSAGQPRQMAGVTIDITDRRLAEESLRQSERRKTVLNQILNVFLTVPDDEMYRQVLAVVREVMQSQFGLFGFMEESGDLVIPSMTAEVWARCQVAGKSQVFPPGSWGESLWGKAIREKRTFVSDGPFHLPEGHLHIDHFLTVPIIFGSETIGLISVANRARTYSSEEQNLLEAVADSISPILNARLQRDRQERKRQLAEDSLRKLSHAVEQSPASIVITNVEGNIEYVNPKFSQLTGYSEVEALGKNPRILKSGETSVEEYRRLWKTITSGKVWRGEFHNRKRNGELYWESASISPIFDAEGRITHFVAVKEDITEHKRLEQEIRQAQKLEAVGQLASGVAHDFNNILAAILMNLGLLRDNPQLTADMVAGLDELNHEARRAASLTRQLLVFSRRKVTDMKPLDLNEVVNNMTRMLRRLIGEDIDLVFQGQSTPLWIMGDAGMMDQVLMNLCVNARDAMPHGGRLTIGMRRTIVDEKSASQRLESSPGIFICITITDTGCGMDSEILKHIFEPFFTTKEPGKGTGLGLATVYRIVNQHHGWIDVESTAGKGTTFQLFLPALPEGSEIQMKHGPVEVSGGSETILVVEDDRTLRRLVALSLRKLGYAVLEAATGAEALKHWEQHQARIDLLFTDMVLPDGMTGMDLVKNLSQNKPSLKAMVTSGYSDEKAHPDLLSSRGITFVAKPYEIAGLASAIRSCLDQSSNRFPDR